jgi:hypothetical protein
MVVVSSLIGLVASADATNQKHFKVGGLAIKGNDTLFNSWNETFAT